MVNEHGEVTRDDDFGSIGEQVEQSTIIRFLVFVSVDPLSLFGDLYIVPQLHQVHVLSILGQTQAGIRAAKPETVGESHLHIMLLGVLGHVVAVKVLCRIAWLVQVESRRHHTLP